MTKPAKFKLNGKTVKLDKTLPALVIKIKKFLDQLPNDELLTSEELVAKLRMPLNSLFSRKTSTHSVLVEYRTKIRYPRPAVVYGNKRTIKRVLANAGVLHESI